MIFRVITYVKLISNISTYVPVEIFSFNVLHQTVSICKEKLCTISILLLGVVIVEVINQSLAVIEDAHPAIY